MVATRPTFKSDDGAGPFSDPAAADPVARWTAIHPLARQLGVEEILDAQYYECRLGRSQSQVDYLVAFSRGAAPRLRNRLRAWVSQDEDARSRGRLLPELVGAWADGRSEISTRVSTLWLEFDDPPPDGATVPVPSVSVCLVPGYRCDRPLAPGDRARDQALARDVLRILKIDGARELALLAESFDQLPPGARWIHLSVMLGRDPSAVKLYGMVPRADLVGYLERVGWQGELASIRTLLEGPYSRELVGDDLFVDLNLDTLRDRRRCTLGLAVAQQQRDSGSLPDPGRWRVLDHWRSLGLCEPGKIEALRAWSDAAAQSPPGVTLPDRVATFLDVKLVWQADTGVVAKAYLGSHRPRWRLG